MLLYCYLNIIINCFLIFFSLIFKVNLESLPKKQVFIVSISIFLKYINSNFIIIFIR